jgi:hypothetical protein
MLDDRTVAAYREYALEGRPAAEVAARHSITVNALSQIKYRVGRMIAAVEAQYGERKNRGPCIISPFQMRITS